MPYAKQSTLIEVAGWQILADATKDEMRKWLNDRKNEKHSVIWLDAVTVGDRPLFCAVAALDDRVGGWTAIPAEPAVDHDRTSEELKAAVAPNCTGHIERRSGICVVHSQRSVSNACIWNFLFAR